MEIASKKINSVIKPKKSLTKKSEIIYANVLIILTLGSSLCIQDSPG